MNINISVFYICNHYYWNILYTYIYIHTLNSAQCPPLLLRTSQLGVSLWLIVFGINECVTLCSLCIQTVDDVLLLHAKLACYTFKHSSGLCVHMMSFVNQPPLHANRVQPDNYLIALCKRRYRWGRVKPMHTLHAVEISRPDEQLGTRADRAVRQQEHHNRAWEYGGGQNHQIISNDSSGFGWDSSHRLTVHLYSGNYGL